LFFFLFFHVSLYNFIFFLYYNIFQDIVYSTFEYAKTAAQISLGLIGIIALWLGIMKVGEKGGVVKAMAKMVSPFFNKLFPEVPNNHPVYCSIMMNYSANILLVYHT